MDQPAVGQSSERRLDFFLVHAENGALSATAVAARVTDERLAPRQRNTVNRGSHAIQNAIDHALGNGCGNFPVGKIRRVGG